MADVASAVAPLTVITPRGPEGAAPAGGMIREEVLRSDKSWVGLAYTVPGSDSGWHHHGDHESYIYIVSGLGHFDFGPAGRDTCEAEPGDFVYVPRGAIHRETNPGGEDALLVVIRVGEGEPVINVDGPAQG